MKTRTQLEKELKAKYGGYHPELWTPDEKAELESIKAANREKTGGAVSVNLAPVVPPKTEAPTESTESNLLALFPERTKKGRPKLTTRAGFFWIGHENELYYSEPQNDVLEYHGTLGEPYLASKEQVLEFIAEYQD